MCKSIIIWSSLILKDSTEQVFLALSPEGRNRSSSRTLDDGKRKKKKNPVCYTPSSKAFTTKAWRSSAARGVLNLEKSPGGPIVAHRRGNNANFDWCHLECSYFKLQIGLRYGLVKETHNFFRPIFRWSDEGWDGGACKTDRKETEYGQNSLRSGQRPAAEFLTNWGTISFSRNILLHELRQTEPYLLP
jgi:hypothetical protein